MRSRFLTVLIALILFFPLALRAQDTNSYGDDDLPRRGFGGAALVTLTRELADVPFDRIFLNMAETEEKLKAAILHMGKADALDPDSRGPNIDARELLILEKLSGKRFRQIGAGGTENPLFFAASDLRRAFRMYFNTLYWALLVRTAGKEIFIGDVPLGHHHTLGGKGDMRLYASLFAKVIGLQPTSPSASAPDTSGYYEVKLNAEKLAFLSRQARSLDTTEARAAFWRGPVTLASYLASPPLSLPAEAQRMLGEVITASDPVLTLENIMADIELPHPRDVAGSSYAMRILGVRSDVEKLGDIFRQARGKSDAQQIVLSSVVTEYLQAHCKNPSEAMALMKKEGLHVKDITDQYDQTTLFGARRHYDRVISANISIPIPTKRKWYELTFGPSVDTHWIAIFVKGDKIDWAYAQAQKKI